MQSGLSHPYRHMDILCVNKVQIVSCSLLNLKVAASAAVLNCEHASDGHWQVGSGEFHSVLSFPVAQLELALSLGRTAVGRNVRVLGPFLFLKR